MARGLNPLARYLYYRCLARWFTTCRRKEGYARRVDTYMEHTYRYCRSKQEERYRNLQSMGEWKRSRPKRKHVTRMRLVMCRENWLRCCREERQHIGSIEKYLKRGVMENAIPCMVSRQDWTCSALPLFTIE